MELTVYQINAFSDQISGGNPACIIPLKTWLPLETMFAVAQKNGLPETAFFIENKNTIQLRWFTPEIEMDLCGHATLAAAHCLLTHLGYSKKKNIIQNPKWSAKCQFFKRVIPYGFTSSKR